MFNKLIMYKKAYAKLMKNQHREKEEFKIKYDEIFQKYQINKLKEVNQTILVDKYKGALAETEKLAKQK